MHELQTNPGHGSGPQATQDYMMPMQYEQRWLAGQPKTVNL